ncbi:hypothetical protein ACB092_09G196900 [Castanea dentata]
MGFFTPSLMNHLCLNAFSRRPRLSTLLYSLHQSFKMYYLWTSYFLMKGRIVEIDG